MFVGCQGLFIDMKEKFGDSIHYIAVPHNGTQFLLLHFPEESPLVEVNSSLLTLR
jgi:calcineurin-like phosphoesterase family protein